MNNKKTIEGYAHELIEEIPFVHPVIERIMRKINLLRNEVFVNKTEINELEAELEMIRAGLSIKFHLQQLENIAD